VIKVKGLDGQKRWHWIHLITWRMILGIEMYFCFIWLVFSIYAIIVGNMLIDWISAIILVIMICALYSVIVYMLNPWIDKYGNPPLILVDIMDRRKK
jgi:hypothetical protein